MRKSNNYFKFLEYVTYGKDHDNTIDKGNGVLECKSYASISDIEYRYNTTFGLENDWLTFKNILIGGDTLYIYYLEGENSTLVGVYLLDNFKTQKELKDTITIACTEFAHDILLVKSEETEKHYYDYTAEDFISAGVAKECTDCPDFCEEDCIENAECSRGYDVFEGCKTNKTIIENINHCPNQNTCCIVSPLVHCDYNYKSDSCIKAHNNFIHDCEQVHKQMKAINNPNWHTVKLAIVNSNYFVRLNEKLKLYISVYRDLKQTISYLRKCKTQETYDTCFIRYIKRTNVIYADGKISNAMFNFIKIKLSMQNVESGVWSSDCEDATGFHKSRRYNKSRVGR